MNGCLDKRSTLWIHFFFFFFLPFLKTYFLLLITTTTTTTTTGLYFPTENCTFTTWPVFTSPFSAFNVVAERCIFFECTSLWSIRCLLQSDSSQNWHHTIWQMFKPLYIRYVLTGLTHHEPVGSVTKQHVKALMSPSNLFFPREMWSSPPFDEFLMISHSFSHENQSSLFSTHYGVINSEILIHRTSLRSSNVKHTWFHLRLGSSIYLPR